MESDVQEIEWGDTPCRQRGAENPGSPQITCRVRQRGKGGLGKLESRLQCRAQKGASKRMGVLRPEQSLGSLVSAGTSLCSVTGLREHGLGASECGAGSTFQQQLGLPVSCVPAAGGLCGAFSWPPHQGKQNRSCPAWLGFAFTCIACC